MIKVKEILDEMVGLVQTGRMLTHHTGKGLNDTKTTTEYAQQISRLFEPKPCEHNWIFKRVVAQNVAYPTRQIEEYYCSKCLEVIQQYRGVKL